jgi:hypothetical protein
VEGAGRHLLAHFGAWAVNEASVRSGARTGTISAFPDYEITMTAGAKVLARPGPLNPAGNWLIDTWGPLTG